MFYGLCVLSNTLWFAGFVWLKMKFAGQPADMVVFLVIFYVVSLLNTYNPQHSFKWIYDNKN